MRLAAGRHELHAGRQIDGYLHVRGRLRALVDDANFVVRFAADFDRILQRSRTSNMIAARPSTITSRLFCRRVPAGRGLRLPAFAGPIRLASPPTRPCPFRLRQLGQAPIDGVRRRVVFAHVVRSDEPHSLGQLGDDLHVVGGGRAGILDADFIRGRPLQIAPFRAFHARLSAPGR